MHPFATTFEASNTYRRHQNGASEPDRLRDQRVRSSFHKCAMEVERSLEEEVCPFVPHWSFSVANIPFSEAWRYTGPFTRWNRFKGAFPGFGIAAVAFGVYVVAEQMFFKDDHHGEGHGEGHH